MKMKQLVLRSFFLVLVTGLIISSCKKDETSGGITGTWTAGTTTLNAMVGDKTLTQYFIDDMGLTQQEAQSYTALFEQIMKQSFTGTIQIKSDNTYTANLGGESDSGTWSLNADQTELTINSSTGGPMTFDVIELTSSKLHIQGTEVTNEDLNSDGIDEVLTVQIDITFTK